MPLCPAYSLDGPCAEYQGPHCLCTCVGALQQQSFQAGFPWWAGLIIALVAVGLIIALLGLACFARRRRRRAKRGAALEEAINKVIAGRTCSQCVKVGQHCKGSDVAGLQHFLYSPIQPNNHDVGRESAGLVNL